MKYPKITLLPGKERSVRLFHPWIFSGAISGKPEFPEGEIVSVYAHSGDFLGTGHFHAGSIMVRLLTFEDVNIDEQFWTRRFSEAFAYRKMIGLPGSDTDCFRLIHGEGDSLPGLIADVYGNAVVIQAHTTGISNAVEDIAAAIDKLFEEQKETIYFRKADSRDGGKVEGRFLKGSAGSGIVKENGNMFSVNWMEGQKTGFFLDQRDNRMLLSTYARGKSVLNTFSYSGGFSVYALTGGAELVHSVDSSAKAAALAVTNAEMNGGTGRHEFFEEDVFDFMKRTERLYDIVVLDPPAFAKHLSALKKASIGYRNLNTDGFRKVAPGGILFTFSCSQAVSNELFRKLVFQAAAQAGRKVRIMHRLSQGPDHPVNIYHPEGEYLKGLALYVE